MSFQIAEQGSPSELASRPDSQFRQMLDQAGISSVVDPQTISAPLARHDTEGELDWTPATTRVTFNVTGDVTPTDHSDVTDEGDVTTPEVGSRAETPGDIRDDEALVPDTDSEEGGYVNEVNEVTRL